MKARQNRETRCLAASLAIATALATSCAWAWDKYYWTGAASADFNSAANWTTNHVDAASEAPVWRSGKELYFETADIVSYRVQFGKNSYGRGGWSMNAGTEAQPLEFYSANGSTIVSPDSTTYNYASTLTVASSCDSWVCIDGGQWDEFASGANIGSSRYAAHLLIGNDRGVDTMFKTAGNFNFSRGTVVCSNATLRVGGHLYVGNNGGTATLTIDGGTVELLNASKFTTMGSGCTGTINLNAGGTLKTTYIHNNSPLSIVFNGGTLCALPKNDSWLLERGLVSDTHSITVTALGGTIDANGVTSDLAIESAIGGVGGMTYKGGGLVTLAVAPTYTGGTTVEAGTVVAVADHVAFAALGSIEVTGLVDDICEVVRLTGPETFSQADLPASTADVTFSVSPDGKSILAANGTPGEVWIGGSGDLATAANWYGGVVPTENATIKWATPITLTNSGSFSPSTLTIPESSAVVTLAGAITVNGLTNAYKLAVASTGSLTVTGDLVGYAASNDPKPLLYSNEGTVTVGGRVRFRSNGTYAANSTVHQYAVAGENSSPIVASGLAYNADSWSDYLVACLGSMNDGQGKWVVGSGGLSIPYSRAIGHSGFRVIGGQSVTLYPSADWTLAESYRHTGNDLFISDTATVTVDTTDYNDKTTGRTVTFKGYINAQGSAETPLTVSGCGTLVLDSVTANNHSNVVTGAIAVTDGATLQINKDVAVGGSGSISLAAGATLSLPANDDRTFTVRDIVPLTLPESGTATLRIDGVRLHTGAHTVMNLEGAGKVSNLVATGTALDGRKGLLEVKDGKLVLNVTSGMVISFK